MSEREEACRDYLLEAFKIRLGYTMMLPEKAHVDALYDALEEAIGQLNWVTKIQYKQHLISGSGDITYFRIIYIFRELLAKIFDERRTQKL